jgi:catechol 2,3-dioxygenase-like lactoylglutathione lyase family enzyme
MGASIGHIVVSVSDLGKSARFYDPLMQLMGFATGLDEIDAAGGIKSYHSGPHAFMLKWNRDREHKAFSRDVGLDHLAFKVERQSEVDELFRMVSRMGGLITVPPKPYPEYAQGYYAFYFRDPDGIPLEIAAY